MHSDTIVKVWAREVLNFRGNPALEAEVFLEDGSYGRATAPAGISTGSSEAIQVLDGDRQRFGGKGCIKAVQNVRQVIAPALKGMRATQQSQIDETLRQLDGTENKGQLGANAILGVSLATAHAAAASMKLPLFRYLGGDTSFRLPVPAYNMLAGGAHAESCVDFQEYLVIPSGVSSFHDAILAGTRIYQTLREMLRAKGHVILQFGGPLAVSLPSNREGIELVAAAIAQAGYKLGNDVSLGMDAAASHLYRDGRYHLKGERKALSSDEMVELWVEWINAYPIVSIEDGLAEDDWEGWENLTRQIGNRVQLVGDDLFTTNPGRLRMGIERHVANAVLIKPNQIGTLTETLEAIRLARGAGYGAMVSTRSGETEDTTISDLSVLEGVGQIKTGPPNLNNIVKHNRLLRIAEALGDSAEYAGHRAIARCQ